ncbi:TPA: hypothetical protein J1Y50_004764 [Escherichia coli]|nr:hypothetical protein [Escherichia coli]HAZ3503436.1 hypothetical protein [Escherichia coli]
MIVKTRNSRFAGRMYSCQPDEYKNNICLAEIAVFIRRCKCCVLGWLVGRKIIPVARTEWKQKNPASREPIYDWRVIIPDLPEMHDVISTAENYSFPWRFFICKGYRGQHDG